MTRVSLRQFVVFALLALLISIPRSGRTVTGTMRGTVTDRSGATLPGVTITIRNVETGLERVVVTEKDGTYNAPFLQIGRYNVQAELAGFGAMRHQNVGVDLNQTAVQECIVDPATMQDAVTVGADVLSIVVNTGEAK